MALDRDLVADALPAYEIGTELGRGGAGIVLHGTHNVLGRVVAVKQLPRAFAADPEVRGRFIDEARVLSGFDHPHIVPIYDFVEKSGLMVLVMEYLSGGTLYDRMTDLDPADACRVCLATAAALDHAHDRGVLHRDIKPDNVMFGEGGTVKVTDFGIAKVLGSADVTRTQAGLVVGTPAYMSPEQAQGQPLTPATDIYSVGIMLYELITGRLPFDEATGVVTQLLQHVNEAPEPIASVIPDVPATLGDVIMQALEKDPADRFGSARAFSRALAQAGSEAFGRQWLREGTVEFRGSATYLSATDVGIPSVAPSLESRSADAPGTGAVPTSDPTVAATRVAPPPPPPRQMGSPTEPPSSPAAPTADLPPPTGTATEAATSARTTGPAADEPSTVDDSSQASTAGQSAIDLESARTLVFPGRTLPPVFRRDDPQGLVGRESEVAALADIWAEVLEGQTRLVLLAGETGSGKSRLVADYARQVHDDGAIVAYGRCRDAHGLPYQPFVEALRFFIESGTPALVASRLGSLSADLARLLPELPSLVPGVDPPLSSDPQTERYRLFEAVRSWLAVAADGRPMLLVLDDLQRAGEPTIALLAHLLETIHRVPILVIASYRDSEISRGALGGLARLESTRRLELGNLSVEAIGQLLAMAMGGETGDEGQRVAARIHDRSEGNAYFAGELIDHMTSAGIVALSNGQLIVDGDLDAIIPDSVRDVVGGRVAALSAECQAVLAVASVVGLNFGLDIVADASEVGQDGALVALEEAVRAGLVEELEPGQFRFDHALLHQTIEEQIPKTRRALLHEAVATRLQAAGAKAPVGEIAHHLAESEGDDAARHAIDYAEAAGRQAMRQLAFGEARRWFADALRQFDDAGFDVPDWRVRILVALGEAQARSADPAAQATLIEGARGAAALDDFALMATALTCDYRGYVPIIHPPDEERIGLLEQAVELAGPAPTAVKARLLARLGFEYTFTDVERCEVLSEEALRLARGLEDPATLVAVLGLRYASIWRATADVEELEQLARQLDDPGLGFAALRFKFESFVRSGRFDEARDTAMELESAAAVLQVPEFRWQALIDATVVAMFDGHLDDAEALANQAFDVGAAAGKTDASLFYAFQIQAIRFLGGRLGELAPVADNMALGGFTHPSVRAGQAVVYCYADRFDDAQAILDELAAAGFTAGGQVGPMMNYGVCAVVAAFLEDKTAAATLRELMLPFIDRQVTTEVVWTGTIQHALGVLTAAVGDPTEARGHLEGALALYERLDNRPLLVMTRFQLGELLASHDETIPQGLALLLAAHDEAVELDHTFVIEKAGALLAEHRLGPAAGL